jgi:DNA-binding NarL/FixJ family response regulator
MRFEGREQGAHRVAWRLFRGEIAKGIVVCHKCDVRACVNPEHLFPGTAAENVQDMTQKGRSPRGEQHGSAKLTTEQVSRIKTMLAEGRLYMSEIAREFGVSQTTIGAIKKGKTWKTVNCGI